MFCAPTKTERERAASTNAGSEVIAGQRRISAWVLCLTRGKKLVRKAVDSTAVLYIFQFAAIRSLRMLLSVFHNILAVAALPCGERCRCYFLVVTASVSP